MMSGQSITETAPENFCKISCCTGSGRNTWRFCKTVVSRTVGVWEFVLERSSSETQSISFDMERWYVEHRAFAVVTFQKQRFCLDSEDISSALQYSLEWVSLVAVLLPLRISQEQGLRKETKDNGGFVTEHQGRSGSNFSQPAATSDAKLAETLAGMCWQGTPPHRHYLYSGSECCN